MRDSIQKAHMLLVRGWIYIVYLLFYLLLLSILYQKMGSFGCFDDCFNFMGGWFLLKGKVLYEQIFFNHQPLAAYISAFVQFFGKPQSIYQLIFFHRLFVYGFSLIFGLLLLQKFGIKALLFLFLYESTKYYFFGDRFLAEGLIVYPLVYLLGLVLSGLPKRQASLFDCIAGTISCWFVIWMREPYIPLALFLYVLFLYVLNNNKQRFISVGILCVLSLALFYFFPFSDYFFSVITVNASFHLQAPFTLHDIFNAFFYPISVFLYGRETMLRFYETILSGVFLLLFFLTIKQTSSLKALLVIFLSLGLANLRPNPPGMEFYEAFHMLSWYSLFLFSLSFLLFNLKKSVSPWIFQGITFLILTSLVIFLAFPSSYIREKTDSEGLFYEGYNQYYTAGEVIRQFSNPDNTLFLDGWNDLIYWQANRTSSYQYSWYTSVMSGFPRYTKAREKLLTETPPDFFYGACKEWPFSKVSAAFLTNYTNILFSERPTCLYVKTTLVSGFSKEALAKMHALGYEPKALRIK